MMLNIATLAFRKLFEAHVETVERGLRVIDAHFLVGSASIDVVAVDALGSLTLIRVELSADDQMFRDAVGAYWWCRRHADLVQRMFPTAGICSQPPRMLFVVQRVARSFLRGVRELGFETVDGASLLDLGIDGSAAVCIEVAERAWRRQALRGAAAAADGMLARWTRRAIEGAEPRA